MSPEQCATMAQVFPVLTLAVVVERRALIIAAPKSLAGFALTLAATTAGLIATALAIMTSRYGAGAMASALLWFMLAWLSFLLLLAIALDLPGHLERRHDADVELDRHDDQGAEPGEDVAAE